MTGEEIVDPLIGSKIGPCRIELRLAAGGMGVVYRARHSTLEQDVAVKILAPSLAADQEYVTRFFREAGAAGQIDHPNVVRVIDVGRHEERYYLVMEFVEGDTLDRIIEQERRLSLERGTKLIREIAAGLAAAHRAGIIHRDVKPGNIIVSPDGHPHLTDFGLARHTETRKGLTVEGTFLGTPEYASPEQVEGRKLDHRTDLYSLGVTYYQLLSGTLPFLGESPMEIAIKRTKEDARPMENAFPGADPRSCAIVKKLLHLEPNQRYQSATDLIRDLDNILQGPKTDTNIKAQTTRRVENVLVTARTRRRVRMFVHWDLLTTAVAMAFLSGGLAPRTGGLFEAWLSRDSGFVLRIILLAISVLAGAGAILIYRRELRSPGRKIALVVLAALMIVGGLAAGKTLDRYEGASIPATLGNTVRALADHAFVPLNCFLLGLVGLFTAVQVSFEREPGSHRVVITRVLMAAGFLLLFAFGAGDRGLDAPFRRFMDMPELSIPLATATGLAVFFGILLVTGYNFEDVAKGLGALLSAAAGAGLIAFAVLVPQSQRTESWTALLAEPFRDFGSVFRESGSLLTLVLALAVVERAIVFSGMRLQDRSNRKRF